ncbi:MAG: rod shape-determining protein MreB [Clostridiales bacterium]|uniref:rod shape-determining protein n=1 Tax=Chordicoccus furentiruminis TaxID=2709410 RepID=UPI0023A87BD7|nr:rod shape-determining protein MreB [Chordicoccus furentiruminis]MCI6173807.1 rod shape-determining protein MreB [Clostridiales bacterium]
MAFTDIGIDMGTSDMVVWYKGKGVIIHEPTIVAYDKERDHIVAFGEEARQLVAHNKGNIVAIRPFRNGTISDFQVTEQMLRYYIQAAIGRNMIRKPNISLCLPSGATAVERRAVEEAAYQAGARDVVIVEETVAAAIGAGIDITKPVGNLVVDIGGGTTDIAVLSIGAPVISDSLRIAGAAFNEQIARAIRRDHNLFIDNDQVEDVKIRVGTCFKRPKVETIQINGRNVLTGLEKTASITSEEIREALEDSTSRIADAVHGVLEKTSPELAADITTRGIVLTGGGALLDGLTELLEERTGINTMVAENPSECVAVGTGLYCELMDRLGRIDF